jgi:hypothetical protein
MSVAPYGKKVGMLTLAMGLITGAFMQKGKNAADSMMQGEQLRYRLRNAYKSAPAHGRSNAAAQKRASVKRRNIAKHPRAKHRQSYGGKWRNGKLYN